MSRVKLTGLSKGATDTPESLYSQLRTIMTDLEAQLNAHPNVVSRSDLRVPQGTKRGDVLVNLVKGVLRVGFFDGKRTRYLGADDLQVLQRHNTNFVGHKSDTTLFSAAATRIAHFPNPGDWGFYENTAGPTFHLMFNLNNTTQAVAM